MARIFVEFSSGMGPLIRCLPILLRLKELNNEIVYFAHKECIPYMNTYGFEKIDISVSTAQNSYMKNDWINADEYWSMFGFADYIWLKTEMQIWLDKISDLKPDIIISDLGVFSAIVARLLDIPLVSITQSCYHPRMPYENQGYWMTRRKSVCTTQNINQLLNEYGKEKYNIFEEIFLGDITLIPSIPEFDRLKDNNSYKKDNSYYIGPIFWKGFTTNVEMFSNQNKDSMNIFCYLGQIRDGIKSREFRLLEYIDCFAQKHNANVVVSLGGDSNISYNMCKNFQNITIVDWVSIEDAYSQSNLIIHHGGHGSCLGLLKYGVPGIVISTHTEREYNGRIVEQLGIGKCLPISDISYSCFDYAVLSIICNDIYRKNSKKYENLIMQEYHDSINKAVEYILSVM